MNYFAHGRAFTHDPYFLVGTALPDMLSACDRQVRLRAKSVAKWVDDADPRLAALARGVLRHLADDDWFHQTAAFNQLNISFMGQLRAILPNDEGYRPAFLGHILVEILLDAWLMAREPARVTAYYEALATVEAEFVQTCVNRLASRSTQVLTIFLPRFLQERFLYDYAENEKLCYRLNQVMRRVGLPPLPDSLLDCLPGFRGQVASQAEALLHEPQFPAIP